MSSDSDWGMSMGDRSFISVGVGPDRLTVRVDDISAAVLDGATLFFYLRGTADRLKYVAGDVDEARSLYENLLTLLSTAR